VATDSQFVALIRRSASAVIKKIVATDDSIGGGWATSALVSGGSTQGAPLLAVFEKWDLSTSRTP
jgi:hypothetical protein